MGITPFDYIKDITTGSNICKDDMSAFSLFIIIESLSLRRDCGYVVNFANQNFDIPPVVMFRLLKSLVPKRKSTRDEYWIKKKMATNEKNYVMIEKYYNCSRSKAIDLYQNVLSDDNIIEIKKRTNTDIKNAKQKKKKN